MGQWRGELAGGEPSGAKRRHIESLIHRVIASFKDRVEAYGAFQWLNDPMKK
jgi:hypothetical protein